jgi:DNA (cytosine-5)-methyltransferase 1
MAMRVVDLFAGCGGLSLGFNNNPELEIVAAYESWQAAIENYRINFNHPTFKFDLINVENAIEHIQQFSPEMIIGGPPCQDFSHAGQRNEGEKANLTVSFAKIIQAIKPSYFVMENVDRAKNSEAVARAKEIFKQEEYGLTESILNASYCNVPQKRKRYFCLGLLKGEDNFLNELINKGLSDKPMTVRDYLGDALEIEYYYRHPRNYNRRGIFSIDEPAPTVRGVNRPVPKGYPGHSGDPVPVTEDLRPLTTLERARLQTFPEDYKWIGSKTKIEQMVGNAVPVKLAEFVADRIIEYHCSPQRAYKQLQLNL